MQRHQIAIQFKVCADTVSWIFLLWFWLFTYLRRCLKQSIHREKISILQALLTHWPPTASSSKIPYYLLGLYYFKGYTKLPERPSTNHSAVDHGQIRLFIPSPGSPETQGAVFYRILCSTNQDDFSNSFLCYPDIVPVGTTEMVFVNLDITTPLYAKVNVLRNFNGEEHPEDGKDTVSAFCASKIDWSPIIWLLRFLVNRYINKGSILMEMVDYNQSLHNLRCYGDRQQKNNV